MKLRSIYNLIRRNGIVEYANGGKEWYRHGQLHREDGPAIEWRPEIGTKEWWSKGERHREDGPAIEWASGDKEWYRDGRLHREDGPAIEGAWNKQWFREGRRHREDGPAVEYPAGMNEWWRNGHELSRAEVAALQGDKRREREAAFENLSPDVKGAVLDLMDGLQNKTPEKARPRPTPPVLK